MAATIVRLATEDYAGGGWAWFLFFSPGLLLPGAVLSVFALAGVWWSRRLHAADAMPLGVDPEDGAAALDEAKGVLQHPLNPLSPQHTMTISPGKKKQSRPTPLPPRSLTSRFRAHAPQQCALSRRSRVTQVASEYPAMLRRPNLVSGGSVASARPLGTVRTLYTDA